jgi:hypothetical protein
MRIYLGKTEIRHGCGLKGLQDPVAAHGAGAVLFPAVEWLRRLSPRHNGSPTPPGHAGKKRTAAPKTVWRISVYPKGGEGRGEEASFESD